MMTEELIENQASQTESFKSEDNYNKPQDP